MIKPMSAKNKKSKAQAYKLLLLTGLLLIAGCALPIAALHSGQTLPLAVVSFMELLSLSALGLIFAQVVFRR